MLPDLFEAAAAEFAARASEAIRADGKIHRRPLRRFHAKDPLLPAGHQARHPWDKICFFWGDERHVPPDDPDSNYRMANEALLSKIPVPPENIFRIHAEEKDAAAAALQYEQTIKDFFHLSPGQFPRFDLILPGYRPRRTHRFPFPRHRGPERNPAPGGRELGAEIQHPPPHFHVSGSECRRMCDISRQWPGQSPDPSRNSGEQRAPICPRKKSGPLTAN